MAARGLKKKLRRAQLEAARLRRYEYRKLHGMCTKDGCPNPQQETNLRCEFHAKLAEVHRLKYVASEKGRRTIARAKKRLYWRRVGDGICVHCGAPELATDKICSTCRERANKTKRSPRAYTRHCSICNGVDHNIRTCRLRGISEINLEEYATAQPK